MNSICAHISTSGGLLALSVLPSKGTLVEESVAKRGVAATWKWPNVQILVRGHCGRNSATHVSPILVIISGPRGQVQTQGRNPQEGPESS